MYIEFRKDEKMTQREIKFEGPAHTIFAAKDEWQGYKENDIIAIAFETKRYGTMHHFYTLGSVISCAIDMCMCPFEAVEDAKKRGHKLHFATQNCVMISSGERKREYSFLQEHGDKIKFHGKMFEIVPTPNDNISLKLV